jgi:hypothetical protein
MDFARVDDLESIAVADVLVNIVGRSGFSDILILIIELCVYIFKTGTFSKGFGILNKISR